MPASARFGLEMPDDFPIDLLEASHAAISDPDDSRRERPAWREWAGACNGVLYRFKACAEHCDRLVASLTQSTAPPMSERYEQEKLLYSFFAEGLSALECLYYGVYFVAALVAPTELDPQRDPREIAPRLVADRFDAAFPNEALTACLRQVLDSEGFDRWSTIRNVLTHRAAPGRTHHEGGPASGSTYWLNDLLAPEGFGEHREWLSMSITQILYGLDGFTSTHLAAPATLPEREA